MSPESLSRKELELELQEMRHSLQALEKCRKALEKRKQEYERLIETAPDAMVFVNRQGKIVLLNAQLEEMFGYGEGELIGADLEILIPERFREKHRHLMAQYFANPSTRPMGVIYEIYALRKDGREFPADISLSTLQLDNTLVAVASVRNITERKQIEEKLEHNYHTQKVTSTVLKIALEPIPLEEQLERILSCILTIPHLSLQSKGGICLVEEETGDLVMKAVHGFADTEEPPCLRVARGRCLCGKAVSTGKVIFSDCRDLDHEYRGVSFPHGHYCVPIIAEDRPLGLINVFVKEGHKRNESEENFLVSIANTLAGVIERRKAQQEKEMLQEQLMETEKQAALGRLTANMAHEIRNPLTAIGGFARRLRKNNENKGREKSYADIIVAEAERLEHILKKVLIISENTDHPKELVQINTLLDESLHRFEFLCHERAIAVSKAYAIGLPLVLIDQEHVREAFMNIIANAVESMSGGGTLRVTSSPETFRNKPYVKVTIEDSGGGIPEDMQQLIFEPFFSTKSPQQGTGLGLVLAKKVVEQQGGLIQLHSKAGEGTALTLLFPVR